MTDKGSPAERAERLCGLADCVAVLCNEFDASRPAGGGIVVRAWMLSAPFRSAPLATAPMPLPVAA
jgi:hypothetical protein